jgi:hypothetical protein
MGPGFCRFRSPTRPDCRHDPQYVESTKRHFEIAVQIIGLICVGATTADSCECARLYAFNSMRDIDHEKSDMERGSVGRE